MALLDGEFTVYHKTSKKTNFMKEEELK